MDVQCGRCGTEYEFDDALISERGTTVKCTNCGYQFKVYPARQKGSTPEQWMVTTVHGERLVFTTIGDLQRAISQRRVGPDDVLSRGLEPPRPLASIAELQPFLHSRPAAAGTPRTLFGVAPPANSAKGGSGPPTGLHAQVPSVAPRREATDAPPRSSRPLGSQPIPSSGTVSIEAEPPPRPVRTQGLPEPRLESNLLKRPEQPASDPGVPPEPSARFTSEPPTIPRAFTAPPQEALAAPRVPTMPEPVADRAPPSAAMLDTVAAAPESEDKSVPTARASDEPGPARPQTAEPPSPEPERVHFPLDDLTDPHYTAAPPRRRARSRWVVLVVLLGAGGLMAATVGKRYIERFTKPQPSTVPVADARVAKLLGEATRLMVAGDYEAAKVEYTKASVLAPGDVEVVSALAGLEVVRADMVWLRLRLLDPQSEELVARTHRELGQAVGRAERAVEQANQQHAKDPRVLRAKVEVARLHGNLDSARQLVGPISKNASQPENAYVLAALDLAESNPAWSSVIHRLKVASSAEGKVGRARALLVYALARSGKASDAEVELEKLEDHPLQTDLASFVKRHRQAGSDGGVDAVEVDTSKLGTLDTSQAEASDEQREGGDFRRQLQRAEAALRSGNLSEAESLYRAVLKKHPGNTEALAGLGDVAAKRNDSAGAAEMYDRVLQQNPSYLPALVASADQKWVSGDRAGAVKLYRRIVDQAGPQSPYAATASRRIAEFEQGASQPASPTEAPPSQPSEPAAAPPAEQPTQPAPPETPHIDTTDLPGFNQ